MKPLLLAAVATLCILPLAAEEEAPPKLENWTITFTRASTSGKVLHKTRVPFAFNPKTGDVWGNTSIGMGGVNRPILWPVSFSAYGDHGAGPFRIRIGSSMTETTIREGTSLTKPLGMADLLTTWQGPGRYEVFRWDDETFTAEILPPTPQPKDRTKHLPEKTIEFVRKDREQKVLARSSAPWRQDAKKGAEVRLPLGSGPNLQIVRCEWDNGDPYLEFSVHEIVRMEAQQDRTKLIFDVNVPITDTGRYLIYAQDFATGGETLEAVIRNTEPAPAPDKP